MATKKQKEKDPAFLMYAEKFIAGTYFMTDEQVGKYIRLLCLQHQTGHLTDSQMLRVLQDDDVEVFSKFKQDEDGKWYNLRMDQVKLEREEFAERQRLNGQKGGRPKAKNNPTDKPNKSTRFKDEDISKEASHTIETNTPNHLFKQEHDSGQSLADLYKEIESI
jgi:hypothetical protein